MGRARSPNYPRISLPDAISKTRQVYNSEHRNRLTREAIAVTMGYEGLTGASQPVISALGKFGLLEGRGDSIQVSDDAVAILVDRKGSPERVEAVRRAASSPKIFADLDKQFTKTPTEETARIYLEKQGFTPDAAKRCASNYRATREFLDAEVGTYLPDDQESDPEKPISVGDLVQWETQGVPKFQEARRVVGISEDEQWVFVEGWGTGIPRDELTLERTISSGGAQEADSSEKGSPPPRNPYLRPPEGPNPPRSGLKRAVLPLDEGEAVFEWPESISTEGAQDIEAWVKLLVTKIQRAAGH